MTDKQMQFIAWLITTATDKCQTMDEVRKMNEEIRRHSAGFREEAQEQKKDEQHKAGKSDKLKGEQEDGGFGRNE